TSKLVESDTQAFGISIDSATRNRNFAKSLGLTYPLLSDLDLKVSEAYGVLNKQTQFANRTTFVVDKKGVIQYIEEGNSAVDPTGAITLCTSLHKKSDAAK
ncbi:MAG: peroxiredoxin family protein, partial [Acidobacteria bacterium]|nr:peroxiredoxin family protein [Acidobacteriota bacterium]